MMEKIDYEIIRGKEDEDFWFGDSLWMEE